MQCGLRKGRVGPAIKLAYQNGSGAGAGLAAGGPGSCMRPPQNLSNMCMSVLGPSQTWGLKTTEVYSLSVLEARKQKSRYLQSWSLWREHLSNDSPSVWCGWQSLESLAQSCVTPVSASIITWLLHVYLCILSSFIRTSVSGFRAHPNPV